jgi:hypothetical protein
MSTLFKQLQSLAQQSGGRLMFSIVADKSGKLTVPQCESRIRRMPARAGC